MIQENVVTNLCLWDGDVNTWQPPLDATMLIQADILAMVWALNTAWTDYVLTEVLGAADIGFTWDGTICTTNQPKPIITIMADQPITTGTTTI